MFGTLGKTMCWQILGRKALANYHLTSKGNPADDPTRDVPLREPAPPAKWLRALLASGPLQHMDFSQRPKHRLWGREAYAGKAGLTDALRNLRVQMLSPLRMSLSRTNCQKTLSKSHRCW